MTVQASTVAGHERFVARQDRQSVRRVLKQIRRRVQLIDLAMFGKRKSVKVTRHLDRRQYHRSPIEMPICVMPARFDGRNAELLNVGGLKTMAVTRDVSLRGVGFLHDAPLEGEHAVVSFDLLDGCPVSMILEICWSNIERADLFMSGGKFLGVAEPLEV